MHLLSDEEEDTRGRTTLRVGGWRAGLSCPSDIGIRWHLSYTA